MREAVTREIVTRESVTRASVMRGTATALLVAALVALCGGAGVARSAPGRPAGPPVPPALTVQVEDSATLGRILADPAGHTLYRYGPDDSGARVCPRSGPAATRVALPHPPGGPLRLPPGLAGTIAAVPGPDGGEQITYDGAPLYRFTGDRQPGDTTGVTLLWHVVRPADLPAG